MQVNPAASVENWNLQPHMNGTSQPSFDRVIRSVYFRYLVKPSSGTISFLTMTSNAGSTCSLQLNTTTGFIELTIGGSGPNTGSFNLNPQLGIWYRADMIYRMDSNPRTASCWITRDNVPQGTLVNVVGPSEAGTTGRWLVHGSLSSTTQTMQFSDSLIADCNAALGDGDWPITPQGMHHIVRSYLPNADGTHAVGTGTFRYTDNNGTTFTTITNGTTDSYTRINQWPYSADGSGSDHWVDKSAGTTGSDLVEWVFADETASPGIPIGVHQHVAALNSAAGSGAAQEFQRDDSSNDFGTQVVNGDIASTTVITRGQCFPLINELATTWTVSDINKQRARFSSTVVSPISRIKAVIMEVAYQYPVGISAIPYRL
jgi:hypothetical protein